MRWNGVEECSKKEKKTTCTKVLKQDETLTRAVLLERPGTCRAFISVKDYKFLSQ